MVLKELIEGYRLGRDMIDIILSIEDKGYVFHPNTQQIVNPETQEIVSENTEYNIKWSKLRSNGYRVIGSCLYDVIHSHKSTLWREYTSPKRNINISEISSDF
ncbi:hypothetical protein HN924_00645 [Candidatus Woesearchaeota archaeon]|jgi:hypothetical protein|nr:hypothetical protein [Candidatus Woesearchaeota archaeon]MBT7062461.1 hypothetical protein [Candidatus Woesearchaeota archaeon]MBT7402894.1 hypothetical protein [Candidatus Woesearchaeota archaeon]